MVEKQEKKNKKIKYKRYIFLLFALFAAFFIAEDIFENEMMKIDIISYSIVIKRLRYDILTNIMTFITNFGGVWLLPIITILTIIFVRNKKIGITMIVNLGCITMLNLFLKNIVQRPRPDGYRLIFESGYSFPSGHSMVSTAFYGLIIYFVFVNIKQKRWKYFLSGVLGILILTISFSRVYLGVHYASDVIAGFLISIVHLICFITIYEKLEENGKLKKENLNKEKKRLINSFKYAIAGFVPAYKKEQNLKIHIAVMLIVIIFGFWLKISKIEWIVCIILFAIVISAELFNTAIEQITNVVMPEINPNAKFVKDVSACSVLVCAIAAAIVGVIIFLPKIFNLF